jgi:hypothetical protein
MSTSTRTRFAVLSALVAGGAVASAGCNTLECADGTVEQNGACVPADEVVDEANCGLGTLLGPDGTCIPEHPPTICGDFTVADTTTMPGTTVCVGTGGGGCDFDLTCPTPDATRVSVCGRLFDVETDARIEGLDAAGARCGSGSEVLDGPCEFEITFYDALDFAGDPEGATPIVPQDFFIDDCGRYQAHNMTRPQLGFLGIGVDDCPSQSDFGCAGTAPDDHGLTGVAFPVTGGEVRNRQKTYVVRNTSNMQWSVDAGNLSPTFVERGAFMTVFTIDGVPEPGVQITEGGAVEAANDYYFDDVSTTTRSSIEPSLNASGMNGAGIKINSALVEHSGTGGALPSGCTWDSALAAAIPGVLFFSPRSAVMGGAECENP